MKINTSELTGAALDWAVGKIEFMRHSLESDFCGRVGYAWDYSTNWAKGGPLIEREGINLDVDTLSVDPERWCACIVADQEVYGPTALIAAMRCYVASQMGDEVEIPEELTK
jgi:hypothetical protein